MSDNESLREAWRKTREDLKQLADEVRVKLHLASADAKDAWHRVEPRLKEFEHKVDEVSTGMGAGLEKAGEEIKKELTRLRDKLRSGD